MQLSCPGVKQGEGKRVYGCGRSSDTHFLCKKITGIGFWRCRTIGKELLINEEIRQKEARIIDADGTQLGIMSVAQALKLAADKNLDLVEIAPQAKPAVCKIMDYGKYKFEAAKREKENRKNQKTIEVKEVRLSPSIDTHDFETKARNAIKFLKAGNKVKVTLRFRGREISHAQNSKVVLERFADMVKEYGAVDRQPKMEGRNMFMFLTPTAKS